MRGMRIVTAALALTGFLMLMAPRAEDRYDFRKTSWGMSMAEVKASETAKQVFWCSPADNLKYEDAIWGFPCYILYRFTDNKLAMVDIPFSRMNHDCEDDYFADYDHLLEKLTKEYGKPLQEKVEWSNAEFQDNPKRWGLAVSKGQMWKRAIWETETTEIKLSMGGTQRRIFINIKFESKALKHIEEETSKKNHNINR